MSNTSKRKAPKRDQKADRARTANREIDRHTTQSTRRRTDGVAHTTVAAAMKASKTH